MATAQVEQKKFRREPVRWFKREPSHYNAQEKLFVACLVKLSGVGTESELREWAAEVLCQEAPLAEQGSEWAAPDTPRWKAPKTSFAPIYEPIAAALAEAWSRKQLEQVGKAMQVWTKAGQHDLLWEGPLKDFLKASRETDRKKQLKAPNPKDPMKNSFGGPKRWMTGSAIVGVASLILRHEDELRDVLANDWPREAVPTAVERIAALEARNRQLEVEQTSVNDKATLARGAHRKAAK